ncbi:MULTISPECIES: hypothetical protein [unclassified Streptomyces]|uniref:hypothetical protein n=1 Tax=unclassified Streptomyces TaxID=2593676 RepID=UPI0037F1F627
MRGPDRSGSRSAETGPAGQGPAADGPPGQGASGRVSMGHASLAAGSTVLAGLAAFGLLAAGCSTGGTGTRDEGAAVTTPVERGVPPHNASAVAPSETVDAVSLLRGDPKVSPRIKADLKQCGEGTYPVDTSYGDLTGGAAPDVVINVMTCGDAVGVGTFVYREKDRAYENVFAAEEPAVYSTIDRGELVVTQQVYAKGDPMSYPSGEDVVTYSWGDGKFSERYRVRNDYSRAAPKPAPEPSVADDG